MNLATYTVLLISALTRLSTAQSVSGKAEGFAYGVTGGGSATPQTPSDIDELKEWLSDETARVIVLDKTYDFTESEGNVTGNVCASWGTGSACQKIIEDASSCGSAEALTATWYKAGTSALTVASSKTILGSGSSGIIKGKGLQFSNNASNIIVQNIQVTDLNPEYVWGGDAFLFDGSDLIWIDHVTVIIQLSVLNKIGANNTADCPYWPTALYLWLRNQHPYHSI